MKNIVRGGAVLLCASMLVVAIYAQTAKKESPLIIANGSLYNIENAVSQISINTPVIDSEINLDDDKKLVKTTGSVKAAGSGASRGSFSATAYCLRGRTATGGSVRRGIIAADPRVLRLGSTVRLEGGGYSGTYQVTDTGGRIKGKKLDIWMPSCSEARRFGRRNIQVFSN